MLRFLSVAILGVALFFALGLGQGPEKRILFIGNSFTFGGDVPVQVQNIAATASESANYHVEMVVRGGTSLEEHIAETNALDRINEGNWDVVVLQDASVMSFRPETRSSMEYAVGLLAEAAQNQGGDVMYYAHWAPVNYAHDTEGAIRWIEQTYTQLADFNGGRVAPAGRMWQMAEDAGLGGLYAEDDHHSSLKGAYVAALAITAALGDVDVKTSTWAPDGISIFEQTILRTSASTLTFNDTLKARAAN